MYITCKCLNVSIKTRGNQLGSFTQEELEKLSDVERDHAFFQESLATATQLEGITKEQSGLVESRNVGSWIVNRCLNCSAFTHAVHREHGAALVLINTDIVMTPGEVKTLQSAPNYSSIFRVVIENRRDALEAPTKYAMSQLPTSLQLALANLQQQLEQAVHRKAVEAEEKIRLFTAEQHQLLEHFRDQVHNELRLLARVICSRDQPESKAPSKVVPDPPIAEKIPTNLAGSPFKFNSTEIEEIKSDETEDTEDTEMRVLAALQYPVAIPQLEDAEGQDGEIEELEEEPRSHDAEALFSLEGVDDISNADDPQPHFLPEPDVKEEATQTAKSRKTHPVLARSLPVSVPTFSTYTRPEKQDEDDGQLSHDSFDPHNIRASIKALAKSVHGDAPFGDLPRPRFSTQI